LEENIKQFEDQYMEKALAQHNSCSPKHWAIFIWIN
jgi:hypothetical protein